MRRRWLLTGGPHLWFRSLYMTTNGSVMISTSTNNLLLTWLFGAPYFGILDVQGIVTRGSQTNNSSLSFIYWSGKLTANHGWSFHASDLHKFVIDVSCHQCPHAHSCPVCEDWICWSIYPYLSLTGHEVWWIPWTVRCVCWFLQLWPLAWLASCCLEEAWIESSILRFSFLTPCERIS